MVKARKRDEADYPSKARNKKDPEERDESEAHETSDFGEESLEAYYMRQQGTPNRNEVIPTWRKPPADRNAEPESFNFETGYGPKATDWPWSSPTEDFKEGQDCKYEQKKPDPGSVPSHSRNFGRGFSGGSKKAP
jgi:hypothetical protein